MKHLKKKELPEMEGQTSDQIQKYSRAQKTPTMYIFLFSKENESKHWKMGGNPFVLLETCINKTLEPNQRFKSGWFQQHR